MDRDQAVFYLALSSREIERAALKVVEHCILPNIIFITDTL